MKVLSIDFDFFVKGSDDHVPPDTLEGKSKDWETLQQSLIKQGKALETAFPFAGPTFAEFLSHFDFRHTPYFDVWDSHLDILAFVAEHKNLEICNVDAHHDLWYHEPLSRINIVDCGNWGGSLIAKKRVKSWTQVYPDWKSERGCARLLVKVPAVAVYGTRLICRKLADVKFAPDVLFVCRSSHWVPPVYDGKFEEFCEAIAEKGHFQITKPKVRFPRNEDTRLLKYVQVERAHGK